MLLYWVSRVWLHRAPRARCTMIPIVFALKDRVSYLIGALTLGVLWLATGHYHCPLNVNERLNSWFHDTVSALAYLRWRRRRADASWPDLQPPYNDLTQFVLRQHALHGRVFARAAHGLRRSVSTCPPYCADGHRFHKLPLPNRSRQIEAGEIPRSVSNGI